MRTSATIRGVFSRAVPSGFRLAPARGRTARGCAPRIFRLPSSSTFSIGCYDIRARSYSTSSSSSSSSSSSPPSSTPPPPGAVSSIAEGLVKRRGNRLPSRDDELFAYKLATTEPALLTPEDLTKAVDLYQDLEKEPGCEQGYMPFYYLQRAILSFPKWIIPCHPVDESVAFFKVEDLFVMPFFTEHRFLEESGLLGRGIKAIERPGLFLIETTKKMEKEGKVPWAFILNQRGPDIKTLFMEHNLPLLNPTVTNNAFTQLAAHLNDQDKVPLMASTVKTLVHAKYYLLEIDSPTPPNMLRNFLDPSRNPQRAALVLLTGKDLAFHYVNKQLVNRPTSFINAPNLNLSAESADRIVDIHELTLPQILKEYTSLGGPSVFNPTQVLEFDYAFVPGEVEEPERMHMGVGYLLDLAAAVGIDLKKLM